MALADLRLALMTFAQRWDGTTLSATLLVVPSGDPTKPLLGAGTAPFAGTTIALRAVAIPSLDALPSLGGAGNALGLAPPPHAAELFAHLQSIASPVDQLLTPPSSVPAGMRKALPATYEALLPPGAQRVPGVASNDEFGCIMRGQHPAPIATRPRPTSWGEVISHALRNPVLATALGLRYAFSLREAAAASLAASGGWFYVMLDPADGGTHYAAAWNATPDAVKCYAARIPALDGAKPRPVFTAVLFPVANPAAAPVTPDEAEIDAAIVEAEIYDDGFAELVHARQPDSLDAHIDDGKTAQNAATDAGIQIGWDDEQVLAWQNRQLAIAAAQQSGAAPKLEAPLGVLGYRIDVRIPTPGEPPQSDAGWQSLMQASATLPPALAGKLDTFDGELTIEPTAASPAGAANYWLPLYFAQWRGEPLGTRDDVPHLLAGGTAAKLPSAVAPKPTRFRGTIPIRLLYGTTYEFRTRLSDLTGGGPVPSDTPVREAVAERARITFSRWVPPKGLRLNTQSDAPHAPPWVDRIAVTRPLIAYPEALFTPRYGADPKIAAAAKAALLAQLGMKPDGTPPPAPPPKNAVVATGLPDPDVVALEITVEVRALSHDPNGSDAGFQPLYRVTRPVPPLPAIPVGIPAIPVGAGGSVKLADVAADAPIPPLELTYVDADDVAAIAAPASGPIVVPRSRDVRLVIVPLADGPPGYFGSFPAGSGRTPVTRGLASYVTVRAPAQSEATAAFAPLAGGRPAAEALFFRPRPSGDAVKALMNDLAAALDLDVDGMTLQARPGERVLFGTTGYKATIAPDGGSITLASAEEILRHWTVAVQARLARDWAWDAASGGAVSVGLVAGGAGDTVIGSVGLPRIAAARALAGTPDRTASRLIFLHAIDPTIPDARDGFSARAPYRFSLDVPSADPANPIALRGDPVALRLPVAVNPAGIPKLASAGYALSAYVPTDDYAATLPRERRLWLEVAEAPVKGDRLFARVLAYAPDPLLYQDAALRLTGPAPDPPLGLDPEYVRTIVPDQSRDDDGLEAMIELTASADDPRTFLIPLPDGVGDDDPRLFGMWTYELRYGHKEPWSLANARYGRPLRVTGVQHPAPELPCAAVWERATHLLGVEPAATPPAAPAVPAPAPAPAAPAPSGATATIHFPLPLVTAWNVVASAAYATPVLWDGTPARRPAPMTTIGFLLYAQARQADASTFRNVLLAHAGATPFRPHPVPGGVAFDYGTATFTQATIRDALNAAGLPLEAPLSVVAVEFAPPGATSRNAGREVPGIAGDAFDPFAPANFGKRRILRASRLIKVDPYC
ncbi:MAG: hypothetical protein JOZ24_04255 [Candidatus Eremiobacteraeota bacterium]|nr:hypothetical protein [Candidatus Eremiobacteraeota bacterium]